MARHTDAQDLGGFLAALRSLNGGYGTYVQEDSDVTPFGAYGMLLENWKQWSEKAGFGGADYRDPAAQDAVAGYWSMEFYKRYGSWNMVANAWYAGQAQTDELVRNGLQAFRNDRIRAYTEAVMAAQEQYAGTDAPPSSRRWMNASTGNSWLMPVAGANEYSNSFTVPRDNALGIHGAIDIYAKRGVPIVAPVAGTVRNARVNDGKGGNWVQLQGDDGNLYYFAHMEGSPTVTKGQRIVGGTSLGFVGNSGSAGGTSPHLHFKISRGGKTLNPYGLLQGSANAEGSFRPENANIQMNQSVASTRDSMNTAIQSVADAVAGGGRVDYRTLGEDQEETVTRKEPRDRLGGVIE